MEEALITLLKSFKIFSSLDDNAAQALIDKFEEKKLNQGDILFNQGDPSDCLYLLVKGKLSATLTTASGESKTIGYIDAGETVGESGALTNEPRSATIIAVVDSFLYKMSNQDLISLCHQFPSVMLATINPIITRSQNVMELLSEEKIKKYIALIPANVHVSMEAFIEKLAEHIHNFPSIIVLSDYSDEFKNLSHDTLKNKVSEIENNKKPNQKILYLLKSHETPLATLCFKKIEMIYIVANADSTPNIDNQLLDIIEKRNKRIKSNPALVLLYSKTVIAPRHTAKWLALTSFSLHHHVRMNMNTDLFRLIRFIRGKAVGLVLGGGGTRGWGHLGVIKALKEAKIPIDIIGGTSVGSIIAACYATHLSYDEAYEKFHEIIKISSHSVSWRRLTWPAISIFDGKNFTLSQKTVFDNIQIEDLWIPYFCISCNLEKSSEEIHRSGTLWERTRSSSSIPGLIPPMVLNGELHYDGGLLNNLPVDIMRQIIGTKGKIIASELTGDHTTETKFSFPPILSFGQTFLAKLGLGYKDYKFPSFMDSFLKAIFVGSLLKAKHNRIVANLLISLDLGKFSMLHADLNVADKLVEIGYQTTLKQLGHRKKISDENKE
jgi:NTE family protein